MREGEVLGQHSQLPQYSGLVPGDVLVVQSVAADVDDGVEGDPEVDACGRDAGDSKLLVEHRIRR